MERSWYAITETCLAFTVFRDDFNPKFVALFTLLLFLKSFHWLAEDRVDYVCISYFDINLHFRVFRRALIWCRSSALQYNIISALETNSKRDRKVWFHENIYVIIIPL